MVKVPEYKERGNALFIILIAIALLAALSVSLVDEDHSAQDITDNIKLANQVDQLLFHMNAIKSKVAIMIDVNGVLPANVKDLKPGDVGYDTAPYVDKIYHPLGGGIGYTSTMGGATGVVYHNSLGVTGIGTAAADIFMVAVVPSLQYCELINKRLYDATTIPEVSAFVYGNMITAVATVLDDATTCASGGGGCDNVSYQCVRLNGGNSYAYYHLLYAQ